MKRFLVAGGLLASLTLLGTQASAQTGVVRGRVLDEKDQPLVDTKIELDYLGGITRKIETRTSKKGEFIQVGLPPGQYRITASKEGYQGASIEMRVALGEPTQVPDFKLQSAARAAQAAAAKGADELSGTFRKAVELTQAGKLDEAEAAYKAILEKSPGVPEAYHNLGVVASLRKDNAAAEAAYLKALELKADYPEAYVGLANVYQGSGQMAKALELMTKAVAANPDSAKVQFQLGMVYFNTAKIDEASAAFKKTESLDPSNGEVHYYLGSLALQQNNAAEAVARLEKYLASSPANPQNAATAKALIEALKPKK